jgi:DNA primase
MLSSTCRSKGGLFAWETVRQFSSVILVEGLFDLAVLWQAGFRHATCAIGTHLTPLQLAQPWADVPSVRLSVAP